MPGSYCSVRDCPHGARGLKKWMETFCPVHQCNKGTSWCICEPPYVLFPFPTERKDPERRDEWTKLMNRKDIKTGQSWAPGKNSRVCSRHFVDGAPSTSFPNPTLNLGYPVPSTSAGQKRTYTVVTVRASKRQKLNIESPTTEDTQNQGPSKEDTPKTSGSDPGTDEKTIHAYVDHTYANTNRNNCKSNCNCDSITRLTAKIIHLENKLKMLGTETDEGSCSGTRPADVMNNTIGTNAEKKRYFTDRFLSDDRSVKLNTGLPNKETFNKLLQVLTPRAAKMRYWGGTRRVISTKVRKSVQTPEKSAPGRKRNIKVEFLMVLMKLRQGLTNEFLASIFSISASLCSNIITTWIKFLGAQLRGLVIWPDKNLIRTMLPASLAEEYPNLRCILDRGETFIDRPRGVKLQAATWSDYKKHNTLKYLVGIAPNGHISFMSKAWGGQTTDRQIVQQSGFLDLVDPQDLIMADRGFPIQEDLLFKMAKLVIPPTSSGLEQMCSQNVAQTKKVTNVHIHVERAINRIKWFQILSTTLPVTMAHLFDDILIICAALCNLLPPLIE
uniref:THAP-type domain-containing protein n=1 Tax=Neogobius melanostomus TaxID=47308 RepID=A0A8C6U0Y4_9GOBI